MYRVFFSAFVVFAISFYGCKSSKDNESKSSTATGNMGKESTSDFELVTYGSMREAIGQQKHHGRVKFAELLSKPHFYGVAALEGLKGEAAIVDGNLTVTKVTKEGELQAITDKVDQLDATMLAGGYANEWHEIQVDKDIAKADFDSFLANAAESFGKNTNTPFLFVVEGKFSDVHFHVINGACPVHARMQKDELPAESKPFEMERPDISGTLVGVYAKDAVGRLTQPATETHRHLVFADKEGFQQVGHVEHGGILRGAKLRIAK